MGELDRLKNRAPLDPRLKVLGYRFAIQEMKGVHPYLQEYQGQILRGQAVAKACIGLKAKGFTPEKKMRATRRNFRGKFTKYMRA